MKQELIDNINWTAYRMEVEQAINNERLWMMGAGTDCELHEQNIEKLREELENILEGNYQMVIDKLEQYMGDEETIEHFRNFFIEGPEKKAKFEAAQKEKREKKTEERRKNIERSEEVATEQRRIAENQYYAHLMEQMRKSQIYDSSVGVYIVGQTQPVAPAVSAYEKAISTMSSSIIQGF